MGASIAHDPKAKGLIRQSIINYLYRPVDTKLQEKLHKIILDNTRLGSFSHQSFLYKGELYQWDSRTPPRNSNRLMPDMIPVMNAYLDEKNELDQWERPMATGYITAALNASNIIGDYLLLLPDALHHPLQGMFDPSENWSPEMTQAQAQEFISKHRASYNAVKQRLVWNLIS